MGGGGALIILKFSQFGDWTSSVRDWDVLRGNVHTSLLSSKWKGGGAVLVSGDRWGPDGGEW